MAPATTVGHANARSHLLQGSRGYAAFG